MDPQEAYHRWAQAKDDPTLLSDVLRHVEPVINAEVQRYPGSKPLLRSKAKVLATRAIKSYDPSSGARLSSWVVTNLQPLTRYGTEMSNLVHVPEVMRQEAAELAARRKELAEDLGSDPTDEALADHTGLSVKRIKAINSQVRAVVGEAQLDGDGVDGGAPSVDTGGDARIPAAAHLVHQSLSDRDRRIMEWKTGHNNAPQYTNEDIAKRLGVTPAYVSQRSAAISGMIQQAVNHV